MKQINVLQINAENFGNGGISTIIWRMYENNSDESLTYSFLSQRKDVPPTYLRKIEEKGGKLIYVSFVKNKLFRYFDRFVKTYRILRNNKYDIVHVNGNESFGIASFVFAAKLAKCKIVVHAHSTRFKNPGMIWLKSSLRYAFIPLVNTCCDAKVACSTQAAQFMFGSEKGVLIIKNGLEQEKYLYCDQQAHELRQVYGATGKLVVGHIGRFVYPKNHEFIVKVFNEVLKSQSNAQLWLIGENSGDGYEKIRSNVHELGISDKVFFIGNTDKIRDYLSAMDVFLFPSRFEGMPLALVEAQANGVPVVCSSSITTEAVFLENVSMISLESPLSCWEEAVVEMSKKRLFDREVISDNLKKNGLDIQDSAYRLASVYRKVVHNEKSL